jgi:uncharacterized protein (DUF1697 family)
MKYVALLRGINVGGHNKLSMIELKACLERAGLCDVLTYINSGNVIFSSQQDDVQKLSMLIENAIKDTFGFSISVVVLSKTQLETIVTSMPEGWVEDKEWKYNYIFLKPPYNMDEVIKAIGVLKPDIETLTPGDGVLYQSMSLKLFGRTTTGKLASSPVYKIMTIRNHNTVTKLYALINK